MAERADRKCWVVGKSIPNNGIGGPFIVFDDEKTAKGACDMVEKVSGERPSMVEGSLWRERQPRVRTPKPA